MKKSYAFLSCLGISLFLLSACGNTGINLSAYRESSSTPDRFIQCHGQGCTTRSRTGFTSAEWKRVKAQMTPPAKNAEAERVKIAKTIAMMERLVGAHTGTQVDRAEAKAPKSDIFQMDCIDETANTAQYLKFLETAGLFTFHRVSDPVHRGFFINGMWPHNTASIQEKKSGVIYVVDAFYQDNGKPPAMIPKEIWVAGWRPTP
jgi:hypothetical protein